MPTYEYLCEKNGRVLEVRHKMAEKLETWGELCTRAGIAPGRTHPDAPVTKLMSAGFIGTGSGNAGMSSAAACAAPYCGSGGGCSGGACSWDED